MTTHLVSFLACSGLPYLFLSIAFLGRTLHDVIRITPSLRFQPGHPITEAVLNCVQAKCFPRHRSGSFGRCLVLLPLGEQKPRGIYHFFFRSRFMVPTDTKAHDTMDQVKKYQTAFNRSFPNFPNFPKDCLHFHHVRFWLHISR